MSTDNSLTDDTSLKQGIPSASHVSNNMSTPVLPAPTAAPGNMGTVQGPSSGNTASSSHSKASNAPVKLAESKVSVTVEASADSSKTDKASSKLRATYIILHMIMIKITVFCCISGKGNLLLIVLNSNLKNSVYMCWCPLNYWLYFLFIFRNVWFVLVNKYLYLWC